MSEPSGYPRPESATASSRRRRQLELPKRRWHILGAFALLALVAITSVMVLIKPAPDTDPYTSGQLALEPLPQPLLATNLNSDNDALPDLLAGEVPEGENPTQIARNQGKTDALGNPVKTDIETPASPPKVEPKVVLVDGKPLDDGSAKTYAELTVEGPFGPLPQKAENGNTSFKAYRKTNSPEAGLNSVSIIIGGLGVNRNLTQRAIDALPANVTLSFAAHSPDLQSWVDKARSNGHEVLLEIPMASDNSNSDEPGADHMLKAGETDKNEENLDWLLSRAQGYYGVINYNGDAFLTRADAAATTLSRLSDSGLAFISDGSFAAPSLDALAQSVSLPYASGHGLIDPEPKSALIEIELSRLADQSAKGQTPIGVGFAYPETLTSVKRWIDDLPGQSLQLVPASAAIK
ncbi:divergent polysaccharide deacetylase family protein [Litorimonas haliclonae]|uniref:divergent polysaccharide deacetylase family protein n=1 Tax=Litorimonas haliclonae TaxID=2081977 RepID=UPI0039F01FCE